MPVEHPRFLTNDEIEHVLSRVAPPQIMITELRVQVHEEVKRMYKYQLEILKLKPSKIEKLGDYIANKSERSFFQPGTPVGFNVAESVGQPATQLVLNTFHSAGQVGQSPFKRFEQNIKLRPYKKNADSFSMKIHMADKEYSYENLYIRAQQFVTVSLDTLLSQDRIIKEEYPFDDMSMYTDDFKRLNKYEDHGCAIRLRFDNEKLFLHQIPLETIALELERIEGGSIFSLFYGPQINGVIDIYPIPGAIMLNKDIDTSFTDACQVFENGFLKTKLQGIRLGEYADISSAHVNKISVVDAIQDVTWDFQNVGPDPSESTTQARVWVNWVFVKKEGVPVEKLQQLLTLTGYEIISTDPNGNYFIVEAEDLKIKENITRILKEEDSKLVDLFIETKRLSSSDLYLAGYYNIITTRGSNLSDVRVHPDVDEFNTISNCPLEIYEVLGLEVARSYLEKEIFDLFAENKQNIAPRNITMMVDWMTAGIRPISVNPKNVMKVDNSVIRAMCFENPKENIVKGAVLSTEEPISNVSSRILFGTKQKLGTGSFTSEEDPEVTELYNRLTSENEAGAFRLTSETLKSKNIRSESASLSTVKGKTLERPDIPQADSDLFSDSDLSKGSEIKFML